MAANPTAAESSHTDANQQFSVVLVQGTLGTADVGGTARTVPAAGDPLTGAAYQKEVGTPFVLPTGGTIGTVLGIGGTVQVSGASAGTFVNIVTGTQQTLGTVGTILGIGGTVQVSGASAGTNVNIVTGSLVGTISGRDANAAAQTANPIGIGGTDSGGTVRTVSVNSNGAVRVSQIDNSVNVLGQDNAGQANLTGTGQTFTNSSNNGLGLTVFTLTGTFVGTVVFESGSDNSAWSPLYVFDTNSNVWGTQATGTSIFKGNAAGAMQVRTRMLSYTSGTAISFIRNNADTGFNYSSIISGTLNTGTLNALASGTITGGTLQNIVGGTLGAITTVSNLTNGSVIMQVGTLTTGTLQNLVTGTINALASGTITGGTLTNLVSGTINALAAGTITTGTVSMTTGTLNGGTLTNLNYGTVNIDPTPIPVRTLITSYGTTGTTGAAVFGTLVAAVGAGTKAYISGYQIIVASGTVDSAILIGTFTQTVPAGGTNMVTRGQFVPSAGVARDRAIPYVSGTNGTICYWMGGAGTVYFQVDYWAAT